MKNNTVRLAFLLIIALTATATPCFAHKIRIFAWQNSADTIMTEAKFSGNKPAKNVTITVIESSTGRQLLSGKTNDKGMFLFTVPQTSAPALDIVVNGGDGHRSSWHYALEHRPPQPAQAAEKDTTTSAGVPSPKSSPPATTVTIDNEKLTELIEAALDRKLTPIRRMLAENSDKGPTIQDILGGIGYIFGLAGIAGYFQSRKNKGATK